MHGTLIPFCCSKKALVYDEEVTLPSLQEVFSENLLNATQHGPQDFSRYACILNRLIQRGADINAESMYIPIMAAHQEHELISPLEYVIRKNREDIVEYLIQKKAILDDGMALAEACKQERSLIVKMLLEYGMFPKMPHGMECKYNDLSSHDHGICFWLAAYGYEYHLSKIPPLILETIQHQPYAARYTNHPALVAIYEHPIFSKYVEDDLAEQREETRAFIELLTSALGNVHVLALLVVDYYIEPKTWEDFVKKNKTDANEKHRKTYGHYPGELASMYQISRMIPQ